MFYLSRRFSHSLQTLTLLLLVFAAGKLEADQLSVAVASNFAIPMKQLSAQFEKTSNHKITVSYASSGKIYAQIVNGAPFDVFLSADRDKPRRLIQAGYAHEADVRTYAIGSLVLLSSDQGRNPFQQLQNDGFDRLSLANPRFAPYGIAANQVLEKLKLDVSSRPKWILGENIAQTYQFASSGYAQLGFVARSQTLGRSEGVWVVPQSLYEPIVQDAVILERTDRRRAAEDFFEFLRTDLGVRIIRKHGYTAASIVGDGLADGVEKPPLEQH